MCCRRCAASLSIGYGSGSSSARGDLAVVVAVVAVLLVEVAVDQVIGVVGVGDHLVPAGGAVAVIAAVHDLGVPGRTVGGVVVRQAVLVDVVPVRVVQVPVVQVVGVPGVAQPGVPAVAGVPVRMAGMDLVLVVMRHAAPR